MIQYLELARKGIALIAQGRETLKQVTDAVKDGKAALSSDDLAELQQMLDAEKRETAAAHSSLNAAIKAARS